MDETGRGDRAADPRAIQAALAEMANGKDQPKRRKKMALVRIFWKEISDLRAEGWSSVEMAERLTALGMEITADTLRCYMSRMFRAAPSRRQAAAAKGLSPVTPTAARLSPPAARSAVPSARPDPSGFVDATESERPFAWLVEAVRKREGSGTHFPMRDGRPSAKAILVHVPDPARVRSGEIDSWEALEASRKRASP